MSNGEGDHVVELIPAIATTISPATTTNHDECHSPLAPLLTQDHKPKINIFTLSYSPRGRGRSKDEIMRLVESSSEVSVLVQIITWVWGGSKYSGLICMAISSTIYSLMEVITYVLPVSSIPLFESILTRCTILMILSFLWLRRTGQPIFGPSHVRSLLVWRALLGCLSLFSFVYSVQNLPMSQAVALNFTTPIMASMAAIIILLEKLKVRDIGGQLCSFAGLLFILRPMLVIRGGSAEGEVHNTHTAIHHVYAIFVGLFSSVTGGISYCFVRAGAKASDQSVITVFAFGLLACPSAAIWTFVFRKFVLPDICSFLLMIVLGVLAFFAEVLLARGLQLEKTSKVTNIHYIEPFLKEIWCISLSRVKAYFGGLFGCLLILASVCTTIYIGPDKEMEMEMEME